MREVNRFELLTAEQEVDLAQRIERGDAQAKEQLINANLRLVISIARRYQGDELTPAGPDPGRHPRSDPGQREVRLAARIQVLDLRDLVDPPGRRTGHRERRSHDPAARLRRRAREADRAGATPARDAPRPAADRGGDRRRGGPDRGAGARHARSRTHRDQPRQARRGRGGHAVRCPARAATTPQPAEEVEVSLREEVVRRAMSSLPDAAADGARAALRDGRRKEPRTIDEVVRPARHLAQQGAAPGGRRTRPAGPHARDPLAARNRLARARSLYIESASQRAARGCRPARCRTSRPARAAAVPSSICRTEGLPATCPTTSPVLEMKNVSGRLVTP